jgi:gamma-glutamylaminecyclotransferase
MTRLFIYGTLKRGGSNHAHLAGQKFLGEARTAPGYTLYSLGSYPGMVAQATDRKGVIGEIWAVDKTALLRLDAFEGVPDGLYRREAVPLLPPHVGARVEAFIYVRSHEGGRHLGSLWPE